MAAKVRYLAYFANYADGDTDGPLRGVNATTADLVLAFPGGRTGLTVEGALVIQMLNQTGGASVKGTVVEPGSGQVADRGVKAITADDPDPVGVIYESGIADGSLVWVVVAGTAQVLLQDSTAGTRGNWARVSATANGRVNSTAAAPPGGGVAELDQHVREIGHCAETVDAGTNVLCWHHVHFL
jgi:hypothetical protein